MNSCATCKHFNQYSEDDGFCEYPVPAWLIIALDRVDHSDKARMPSRYAPCACYDHDETKDD